ncbi:protein FAR1-RELATED SEQUENCE 1-like [Helianthus annuus]|uniref:protein FAR1-RELATED SEQUENCE 1-like n=1 Tax=Helianthus annuus TaxID=4232 RepID=UPI000B9085E6|nr:protein FAR1-RELATED SEQUENCE 1-like [Helianthus annuus]
MSNVSSSVDAPNNSSDDALNNSINTNVVDEEEPHIQDFQESVRSTYYHSPNGTRYWIPNVLEAYRPVLGTVFAKEEDAISMLSTTKKSKDGTVRLRYVLCSRSGKPNCQNVDSMLLKSSSKLPRSSNYKVSDCKAKIKVKVFNGYPGLRLYEFVESHNHPLVSIENMDLTRKRRQLEFSDQDFIHRLSLAKVGLSTAFKMYNMIFVPFTGVDHHKNCVTFAAALLYDETIESFTWMLEQFLEAHGKQPRLVLTDQDPAMKQAIAKVFNESVHRLCMWHIMDKHPHKIDGDVLQNTNLRVRIHKLVWNVFIAPATFEKRWELLTNDCNLQRHKWLFDMFSIRDQWVPVYVVF